jgi:glycopeptide antibiotics resistance protein
MLIRFDENDFLIGLGVLCGLLLVFWWQKRSFSSLVFFSIFWVYLLVVVQTVIFPIAINTDYSSPRILPSINLIPFYSGYCSIPKYCIVNIVGNIILTIPFGFGINFLLRVKPRNFLWLAAAIGFGFEFSQLVISLACRSGFRTIDINDALLNATGVLIGYILFRAFAWAYLKITGYFEIEHKWLFAEIYNVVLQAQATDKSQRA